MSYYIRKATTDDIPAISSELKLFSDTYGTTKSLYKNHEMVSQNLVYYITEHLFYVAVESETDLVVGLINGILIAHPYNQEIKTLVEGFWWVNPAHRNSRAGALLLSAYIEAGKKIADWVIMSLEHDSPVNETTLTKRGFILKEKTYLLESGGI
jgi:hypothetical protein